MALAHHDHDVPFNEQSPPAGAPPPPALEGAPPEAEVVGMQYAPGAQVIEPGPEARPFNPSETVSYSAEEMAAYRAAALEQVTTPPEIAAAPAAKKHTWLKIGAPLVAVATLAAGAVGIATMGRASSPEAAPTDTSQPFEAPSSPSSVEPSDDIPTASAEIIDGEPTLEATRPTGEKIVVAQLRSPEDHTADEVVASFMGLADCWATTGDQACLDAISSRPDTQQVVIDLMDHVTNNVLQNNNMPTAPDAFQVVSFKDPADPAGFAVERSGSAYTFTLAEGAMRLNPYTTGYEDDYKWRDPQVLDPNYTFGYKLDDSFTMTITNNAEGKPEVQTLSWRWTRS